MNKYAQVGNVSRNTSPIIEGNTKKKHGQRSMDQEERLFFLKIAHWHGLMINLSHYEY